MTWWELIGLAVVWFFGVYLRGKIYEGGNGFRKRNKN
jgi:hypothetical protein